MPGLQLSINEIKRMEFLKGSELRMFNYKITTENKQSQGMFKIS